MKKFKCSYSYNCRFKCPPKNMKCNIKEQKDEEHKREWKEIQKICDKMEEI